jgi:hypothetical protein
MGGSEKNFDLSSENKLIRNSYFMINTEKNCKQMTILNLRLMAPPSTYAKLAKFPRENVPLIQLAYTLN